MNEKIYKPLLDIFLKKIDKSTLKDSIKSIVLFGSIARGKGKPESNIDLFIVFKGSRKMITKFLTDILIEIRNTEEYINLRRKGFLPEIYPFLIRDIFLHDALWIFFDATEEGIILKDLDKHF